MKSMTLALLLAASVCALAASPAAYTPYRVDAASANPSVDYPLVGYQNATEVSCTLVDLAADATEGYAETKYDDYQGGSFAFAGSYVVKFTYPGSVSADQNQLEFVSLSGAYDVCCAPGNQAPSCS